MLDELSPLARCYSFSLSPEGIKLAMYVQNRIASGNGRK